MIFCVFIQGESCLDRSLEAQSAKLISHALCAAESSHGAVAMSEQPLQISLDRFKTLESDSRRLRQRSKNMISKSKTGGGTDMSDKNILKLSPNNYTRVSATSGHTREVVYWALIAVEAEAVSP